MLHISPISPPPPSPHPSGLHSPVPCPWAALGGVYILRFLSSDSCLGTEAASAQRGVCLRGHPAAVELWEPAQQSEAAGALGRPLSRSRGRSWLRAEGGSRSWEPLGPLGASPGAAASPLSGFLPPRADKGAGGGRLSAADAFHAAAPAARARRGGSSHSHSALFLVLTLCWKELNPAAPHVPTGGERDRVQLLGRKATCCPVIAPSSRAWPPSAGRAGRVDIFKNMYFH